MTAGHAARLAAFLLASIVLLPARADERVLQLSDGDVVRYTVLDDASSVASAQPVAMQILRHLADGEIEEAAVLSNAPRRRFQVLREYQERVGADEFKRVFSQYFSPANHVIAEIALGSRRLLVWRLGDAANHLAGQYFDQIDGRFYMDDVPSEERGKLRRVLQAYRAELPQGATPSASPFLQ